jgi:hypothetical protein
MELLPPSVIATNALGMIPGSTLTTFGMMSSRPFTLWTKAVSGRIKNDIRITNTTYNNFPFPELTDEQTERISKAAQSVVDARKRYPNNSLADLYDAGSMPSDLRAAHTALDRAVLGTFGLKTDASDSKVLEVLFDRYSQAVDGLLYKAPTPRAKGKK